MDIKELQKIQNAKQKGIPEEYAGREIIEAHRVTGTFVNDSPAIIVEKPKYAKNADGKFERVLSKAGKKIVRHVVYIPIKSDVDGREYIVANGGDENVKLFELLIDEAEGVVTRPADDAEDRIIEYRAQCVIEGKLRFVQKPKRYANGRVFDVAVLEPAE